MTVVDIVIPPRRDEPPIGPDGQLTIRFARYLEDLGGGTNEFELRITQNEADIVTNAANIAINAAAIAVNVAVLKEIQFLDDHGCS